VSGGWNKEGDCCGAVVLAYYFGEVDCYDICAYCLGEPAFVLHHR
jgi:hypothetical protein